MDGVILRLSNLTKTYIIGNRKDALKTQKALTHMQKLYERAAKKGDHKAHMLAINLAEAQRKFADDKYGESYELATGNQLKQYPTDTGTVVHALRGIDLKIHEGEMVAIMGPSGSGKSTLLNMLGLLDQPTAGQMYIRGRSVANIEAHDLPDIRSRELGFVFQSFNLVPTLTALENVMLPLKYVGMHSHERKDKAKKALEQVGLTDRMNHTPNELSGGQRQRVAIARSIVNHPAIILGDELTGELDSSMTEEIMQLILKLNDDGQTFIIVTHNPEVASRCKRVIYMRDGMITQDSSRQQKTPEPELSDRHRTSMTARTNPLQRPQLVVEPLT